MSFICKPGDRVICKIKNDIIVPTYEQEWEQKIIFDIAVKCKEEGHIIIVPSFLFLKNSKLLNENNYKELGINKKFIGSYICYMDDYSVFAIHSRIDGMSCNRCNEFCQMAESNQEDGSFLCFLCKKYKYR